MFSMVNAQSPKVNSSLQLLELPTMNISDSIVTKKLKIKISSKGVRAESRGGSEMNIKNLVIKTKSVEYMPFYLSLATFLMSLSFFAYGMFKNDPFISVPNGIGGVLGVIQLVLYFRYSNSGEEPRAPLLDAHA